MSTVRHLGVWPDASGHFGPYGGRFVPETLMEPLRELEAAYAGGAPRSVVPAGADALLRDYVGRPTPLGLAARLSERLGCRIYLKREDLCHTGAHKINNALGQGLLVKRMGKKRVVAETGAGQHGVATATVCALLGLECVVYMGTEDMARQAPNVRRMRLLGAEVRGVESGSRTLKDAINEAMRDWVTNVRTTHYLLGSVLGAHPYPMMVRDFQAVIGEEARAQVLERARRPARSPRGLRRRRLERDRPLLRVPGGRGGADGRGGGGRPLGEAGRPRGPLPRRGRGRGCPAGNAHLPAPGRGGERPAHALRLRRPRLPGGGTGARAPPRREARGVRVRERRRGPRRLPPPRRDRGHPARARVRARPGLARPRGSVARRPSG